MGTCKDILAKSMAILAREPEPVYGYKRRAYLLGNTTYNKGYDAGCVNVSSILGTTFDSLLTNHTNAGNDKGSAPRGNPYVIINGYLYYVTGQNGSYSMTQIGSNSDWTQVVGIAQGPAGLAISGGRLYYLSTNTATLIDATKTWVDVQGSIVSYEHGLAIDSTNTMYWVVNKSTVTAITTDSFLPGTLSWGYYLHQANGVDVFGWALACNLNGNLYSICYPASRVLKVGTDTFWNGNTAGNTWAETNYSSGRSYAITNSGQLYGILNTSKYLLDSGATGWSAISQLAAYRTICTALGIKNGNVYQLKANGTNITLVLSGGYTAIAGSCANSGGYGVGYGYAWKDTTKQLYRIAADGTTSAVKTFGSNTVLVGLYSNLLVVDEYELLYYA